MSMAFALLLLAGSQAEGCLIPEAQFSMTTEPEESIAAEVYLPCKGQTAEELVAALVERDGKPVDAEIMLTEREVEVSMTGLSEPGGDQKTAILRRAEQGDDAKPYVCRVHKSAAGDAPVWRAVQWCMTFVVGPTATAKISPPSAG
ncbi:MAG: hypothetical protein AAFQ27_15455 [Pseudomonadota bacterium]